MNRRRTYRGSANDALSVIGFLLVLVLIAGWGIAMVNSRHDQTCTVEEKDRTRGSEGGSDMRIYTEDCGVLRVKDSLWAWNWHSSDTYAEIKPGKTYVFTMQGWRVPFLSMFPNVIAAEETTK